MNILFVEPDFPVPSKSKNHKNFLPIGLLKIFEYERHQGNRCKIARGCLTTAEIGLNFIPEKIMVTSLFTYWSEYVWNTVEHYRAAYPHAEIIIGGIYASLMNGDSIFNTQLSKYNARAWVGLHGEAEEYSRNNPLDYSVLSNSQPIDYQIIHASRGCIRKCDFCGTWRIEPKFEVKDSIREEICKEKIVFYDNNLLANPYIEDILDELIEFKRNHKIIWCESQSGFDGRKLEQNPSLAKKLKKAGFRNPRIAWDNAYSEVKEIESQLKILRDGGYTSKEIMVFMIYNWKYSFDEMEDKRIQCFSWGVQISDCRFRPLDQSFDHYNGRIKGQTSDDYYIHISSGWSDELVKQFRKNIREQNICIRHNFPFYSRMLEQKGLNKKIISGIKQLRNKKDIISYLEKNKIDYWFPDKKRYPGE